MRNLLNFLLKYSTWFVFTFYVLISCFLLFKGSDYRMGVYLSSANEVGKVVYGTASEVTDYFGLLSVNRRLQESNARLENEVLNLKNEIKRYQTLVSDSDMTPASRRFDYVSASVINNSTSHPRNHFTIDRGSEDGVKAGMGVVDQSGVVGIVNATGPHTSRVISLLNQTQLFSAKLKGTPYVGSLTWKGIDPTTAYLEEVPRHAKYHIGDTIVTSGHSTTFPEGINIGTVAGRVKTNDDTFYILKVKLASDFKTLGTVRVIKDELKQQLDSLQNIE